MRVLTDRDVRRLRLRNQWLTPRPDVTAEQVATHMGALQAQELWSGEWSIGARSTGLTLDDVRSATLYGQILRTWPLRGTIHFIPATDVQWMLAETKAVAFTGVERRREFLGLDEADALAAVELLRQALGHGHPMTRSECLGILEADGLLKDKSHAYHLLWFAAQHGATCIGPQEGKEQTFVNLDRWVPELTSLTHEEALAEIAYRYFDSHGPADEAELRRWTGLPASTVRRAIELAGDRLAPVETTSGSMLVSTAVRDSLDSTAVEPPERGRSVLLLSGFDEYVLGYGDRSTMMTKEQMKLVVPGNNGVFRPTVVDDGVMIGTWKRSLKKARVDIAIDPFGSLNSRQLKGIERAAEEFGTFTGVEARVAIGD